MKYEKDLTNYIIKETPFYIQEVNINTLDFMKLENEIKLFQEELNWNDMWNIEEVKDRLLNGWRFVIFKPSDEIKGWIWLDSTNEPKNIYVNKDYRKRGIAKELYYEIHNICKKNNIEKIIGFIDDWNYGSRQCIESVGWYKISD